MLTDFPVTVERPLEWGEMDAFGHLNNVVYFRLFENARILYFGRIKIIEEMKRTDVGPILKSTSCVYRTQLKFPDMLTIGAKVVDVKVDRFLMNYAIFSHHHQKLAAEGEGLIVSLNYRTGEKAPIPDPVVAAIELVEKHTFARN